MSVQSTILNKILFKYSSYLNSVKIYCVLLLCYLCKPSLSVGLCFLIYRMIGAGNMNF